jgi:hypothetical protein
MDTTAIIKMIGRSYLISSFLPTAFFTSVGWVVFRPSMARGFYDLLASADTRDIIGLSLVLLFILWFSLVLHSSLDFIIKIYDGSFFPVFIRASLIRVASRKPLPSYRKYAQELERLHEEGKTFDLEEQRRLLALWQIAMKELKQIEFTDPIDPDNLMPTRLGNILKATEEYAVKRYHLDSGTIWPRLSEVLPSAAIKELRERANRLLFFLNSSLLSYLLGVLLILGPLFSDLSGFGPVPGTSFLYYFFASRVWLGYLFFIVGYGLYRVGTRAGIEYSLSYRVAFDLHRSRFLKAFNLYRPTTLTEERMLWEDISSFFIAGDLFKVHEFHYKYLKKDLEQASEAEKDDEENQD